MAGLLLRTVRPAAPDHPGTLMRHAAIAASFRSYTSEISTVKSTERQAGSIRQREEKAVDFVGFGSLNRTWGSVHLVPLRQSCVEDTVHDDVCHRLVVRMDPDPLVVNT